MRVAGLIIVGCGFVVAVGAVGLAQQAAAPQEPFRAAVDLIRIDVSVLDSNRVPVRGLTAADFTVIENGKPQRIVAVSEVDATADDPTPTAWMRYAGRDVAGNDLSDQLSDGQAVGIVIDDDEIPFDDSDIIVATRALARYIINGLRPSDMAAVVFPVRAGETQDFTSDRSRLLQAIDKFRPQEPDSFRDRAIQSQPGAGPIEGDMQRYSPVIGRDPCLQLSPVLPTLRAVTSRLATVPNQRKTLFLISVGSTKVPIEMGRSRCQGMRYEELRQTLRLAQRSNVNIHTLDPAGYRGYENYLTQGHVKDGRMVMPLGTFQAHQFVETVHEYLKLAADQTGGRSALASMDVESDVDQIFAEASSYYLIGYETSNPNPDGKFRNVDVKVKGRDITVHAKTGYWAPDRDSVTTAADRRHDAPSASELSLSGMAVAPRLALRAVVHPVAVAADGTIDVAAVLTVRVPAPRQAAGETLTVIRTIVDLDGRTGRPTREILTRTLEPGAGDVVRYDALSHFSIGPGRYEIRLNAQSELADAGGSVYPELELPDIAKSAFTVPGIILGTPPAPDRSDPLASVVPIVPVTAREFTKTDRVVALLRVFQGGSTPAVPVAIQARILGADDSQAITTTTTLDAGAFAANRSADYRMDLPLSGLPSGLHLLSITATLPQGRSIRRDVVFRVR